MHFPLAECTLPLVPGRFKGINVAKTEQPKQRGMGFVEVLVASAILALTVAGSVTLLGGWTQTMSEVRNRTDGLVRLMSVMDIGKHDSALISDTDNLYVSGAMTATQSVGDFQLTNVTVTPGTNRDKFSASIQWLSPYESGGGNSNFGLESYSPKRNGFVGISTPTTPVCSGSSCDDDDSCLTKSGKQGKGAADKNGNCVGDTSSTSSTSSTKSASSTSSTSSTSSCNNPNLSLANNWSTSEAVGSYHQLNPSSNGGLTVSYSSANEARCTVNSDGWIYFVSSGTCSVTASTSATSGYCAGSATANITVGGTSCAVLSKNKWSVDSKDSGCDCVDVDSKTGSITGKDTKSCP